MFSRPIAPTALQSYAARSMTTLAAPYSSLPPDFSHLDLGLPSVVTRNLEQVVEGLDSYRTEENNVAYLTRQIAREKTRADAYITGRKEENVRRVAQGLPPLPEEDVSRLFKIPPEPNRLESMLLLGQIDASAKNLEEATSTGLVRIYAAQNP
jgi:translation initiation factor 3 subunit H